MLITAAGRIRHRLTIVATAAVTCALCTGALFTAAGASPASEKAQAKKLLLVAADMPRGWKTEKGSGGGGSGNIPGATQLASCIGVPPSLINSSPPEADSPYFENKSGSLEVQDEVSVYSSSTTAARELAAIANPKTPACMATLLNGSFKARVAASAGKGSTLGVITVTRADPANFGHGTTGLVISLPITASGVSITADIAAIYATKGRFGQEINFNSYGSPFPSSTARALVAKAVARL
jgi:hypothetical protein